MLEGLDKVDWASIEHAYGPATDIPEMLHGIAAADPLDVEDLVSDLENKIAHQTSIYPATPYVVPFLIEIAREGGGAGGKYTKIEILQLLAFLGGYGSLVRECAIPVPLYPLELDFENIEVITGQNSTRESPEEILQHKAETRQEDYELQQSIHKEVRKGLPLYIECLADPHAEVRSSAAGALMKFGEDAATSLPTLSRAYMTEEEVSVRKALLESMGAIMEVGPKTRRDNLQLQPYIDVLVNALDPNQPQELRLSAATILAPVMREHTPATAITLMTDALLSSDRSAYYDVKRALPYTGEAAALPAFCRKLEIAPDFPYASTVTDILEIILDLAFGGKQLKEVVPKSVKSSDALRWEQWVSRPLNYWSKDFKLWCRIPVKQPRIHPVTELTPLQKQAVRAIVECNYLWAHFRTDIFKLYGLPSEREELDALSRAHNS